MIDQRLITMLRLEDHAPADLVGLQFDREHINLLAGEDLGIDFIAIRHGTTGEADSYVIGLEISCDGETHRVHWPTCRTKRAPLTLWTLIVVKRARQYLVNLSR